jgi:hypothetical protein
MGLLQKLPITNPTKYQCLPINKNNLTPLCPTFPKNQKPTKVEKEKENNPDNQNQP